MPEAKEENFLKKHLNVSWLRPESALWDAVASRLISKIEISAPSLDLGCGNGIFSFITAGGDFSVDYDWYANADPKGFWSNKDIYDTYKAAASVKKRPGYCFSTGLDHKENLLRQARGLNFYRNLIKHNANRKMPFGDCFFKTVFSNIIYWLPDIKGGLGELYRIMDEGGVAILCVPNTKFFEYCPSYHWKKKKSEVLRLLNRGRSECMHWAVSYGEFVSMAKKSGFRILSHSYYLSPLILKIWDIGLRPLSPLLIKIVSALDINRRRDIKREWIGIVLRLLQPVYEFEKKSKEEGGFHLFVLKK